MDYGELWQVFCRGIISLLTLFLMTKLLGKKQVSEMSVFDYVIGISIGNFAAEMTINLESHEVNGVLAVVIFGVVAYLVSLLSMKSMRLRRFFMGMPTVIIENGKLLKNNMKKINLDVNDLLEECRMNGYFDLSEIEYAVMEANGHLSFLQYAKYKTITLNDMNLKGEKSSLCANVIIDGHVMHKNLQNINKSIDWLKHNLEVQGYHELKDILLCTVDSNDKVVIYDANNNVKFKDIFE